MILRLTQQRFILGLILAGFGSTLGLLFQGGNATAASSSQTAGFSGEVVSIQDVDTITVLRDGVQVRIRLHGIDYPEHGQPFGTTAREFTGRVTFEKTVKVRVRDVDRYGLLVGEVILPDGRTLNHELVKGGPA